MTSVVRRYQHEVEQGVETLSIMDNLDWREPANDNSRKCLTCGNAFSPNKHNQKYCGKECRDRRSRTRTRDRRGEPRGGPERTCEYCGDTFHRRADKHNAARFCSRKCGFAAKANMTLAKRASSLRVSYTITKCKCAICGVCFEGATIAAKYCSDDCRIDGAYRRVVANDNIGRSPRPCEVCGEMFTTTYGDKRSKYCSAECGRKSDASRAVRKAAKLRRRCAVVEIVNPIEVFKRDGWRCRLCGVKTPSKMRGTYEPNAPELDHIIPIAAGGEHSYRNTQCACRKCNGAKGATPLGQMLLFG